MQHTTEDKVVYHSAFIDLVGVRALAEENPDGYKEVLDRFRSSVGQQLFVLTPEQDNVYFFSDCAFIESVVESGSNENRLVDFLTGLRADLLSAGIFFKGSLGCCKLEAFNAAGKWDGIDDEDIVKQRRKVISGHYFGRQAASLYGKQNSLKGIGIFVDETMPNRKVGKKISSRRLVRSLYFDRSKGRAVSYYDIAIDEDERNLDNFNRLIEGMFFAVSRDKMLGAYYLSPVICWINSLDLSNSKLPYSVLDDFDKVDASDPIVGAFICGEMKRYFSSLHGYELVLFAFLHQLCTQKGKMNEDVWRHLWYRMFSEVTSSVRSKLESVPNEICNRRSKEEILEHARQTIRRTSRERRSGRKIQES